MQYLFLIYGDEAEEGKRTPEEQEAEVARYVAFSREARTRGMLIAGEQLHPTAKAMTVRTRRKKTVVTTGPFAETKEQLGGYFVLECKDMDEALAMAKLLPAAQEEIGSVEVRPIVQIS